MRRWYALTLLLAASCGEEDPAKTPDGLCNTSTCPEDMGNVADALGGADDGRDFDSAAIADLSLTTDADPSDVGRSEEMEAALDCSTILQAEDGELATIFTEEQPFTALLLDVPPTSDVEWVVDGWRPFPIPEVDPDDHLRLPVTFPDQRGYFVRYSVNGGECVGRHYFYRTLPGALMVALEWETPDDLDEADDVGADLDLHFLHPNGTWLEPPWDLYWRPGDVEWGPFGPEGNAYIVDGRRSHGPEVVVMEQPEELTYSMGVFYYADFGPANATLRVFSGLDEVAEESMVLETREQFWRVGTLSFPGTVFVPDGAVSAGFPD